MNLNNNAIYTLADELEERLGSHELLESLEKALGTYKLLDNLDYICRANDFKYNEDGEIVEAEEE